MIRRLFFVFLIFICTVNLCSQTLHGWTQDVNPESSLSFWNNVMKLILFGDPPDIISTTYTLQAINKVQYLEFVFPENKQEILPNYFKGTNKWLVLFSDGFMYAYRSDSESPVKNGFYGSNGYRIREYSYFASSSLKENNTLYSANNLSNIELMKPWVEGVSGYGIGEYIIVTQNSKEVYFSELLISIGFVSYEKPYLYEKNSRPKQIELTTEDGAFNYVVELFDTPNIQTIKLPKAVRDIKIIIKDIYKGTEWDDTCINFIIPLL